ncbi:MAG: hypothetical protein IPJ19_20295 [Planctomycetes bacterium]|nr:hypothetical protein [Planctomycetota bacterium]
MNIQRLSLALPLLLLGACTTHEGTGTQASGQDAAQAPAGSAATEEPLLAPADAAIPTAEEAAAAAAKKIDDSNADAELEKLKQELQGGH